MRRQWGKPESEPPKAALPPTPQGAAHGGTLRATPVDDGGRLFLSDVIVGGESGHRGRVGRPSDTAPGSSCGVPVSSRFAGCAPPGARVSAGSWGCTARRWGEHWGAGWCDEGYSGAWFPFL